MDIREQEYQNHIKAWAPVAQRLAHGIKNPLTTIKLNAEELHHILHENYKLDREEIDGYFANMLGQIHKLKQMSDGFMRFVEFSSPVLESVDLNAMLNLWCNDSGVIPDGHIIVTKELDNTLPPVLIDRARIEEVLTIVVVNAIESMPKGGHLIFRTTRIDAIWEPHNQGSASQVELHIRDTGKGIPANMLPQVCQPFVSIGKEGGTGLGLTIAEKIMQAHSGALEVYSEENMGTTVILRFQIAEPA